MQNFKIYIRRLKKWLYDAWPFGLFLIVFFFAIFIPSPFPLNPVDHVHYTGFILQFSAFLTIILRINWAHKHFSDDNHDFLGLILEWLKRFPNIFKKPESVDANMSLNTGHQVQLPSESSDSTEKTLEQRIADIEENLKSLEEKIKELEGTLTRRINELVSDSNKQIGELKNEIKSVKKETKQFNADKLKPEIVWSLWLIIGLTMRSIPEVVAGWFM